MMGRCETMPIPRLIAWELTRCCNLRCAHCRANAGEGLNGQDARSPGGGVGTNGQDARSPGGGIRRTGVSPVQVGHNLSVSEAKAVVDDIASFAKPILILTGGEPLLCPYLFELIAYAREKGLKPVIGTNATLIDDAVAAKIAAAGVPRISVSIDFPTASDHDRFRGVEGAFDAALRGIRAAIRAGVEVQINSTVTKLNRDDLPRLHDLAVEMGAKAFHPFLLVPTGRGADLADAELSPTEYEEALSWICRRSATSPLELKPTDAPQYQRILREWRGGGLNGRDARSPGEGVGTNGQDARSPEGASARTGETPVLQGESSVRTGKMPVLQGKTSGERASCPFTKGCLAGTGFAFIGHCGDVQPCGYFDLRIGNVREKPFSRIWAESPVLDDLRHPERLKGKCGICEFKSVCGGCRARALAKTGDYLSEEPYCVHVPDRRLLDLLQTDFPLVEHPYAALGEELGLSEAECYERAKRLSGAGLIRRIGASFDSRKLGYVSTLVAAKVAADSLDAVAAKVNAFPEVTHNYVREGEYNLWFTVIAQTSGELEAVVEEVRREKGVERVIELPAIKTYKLSAVFGERTGETPVLPGGGGNGQDARSPGVCAAIRENGHLARSLIRKTQGDILPFGLMPFSGMELLQLQMLIADGTIRRFGAIVNHWNAGARANALTAWRVDDQDLDRLGAAFAEKGCVSHCYARKHPEDWPYSLYAMVHAGSDAELSERIEELEAEARTVAGVEVRHASFATQREYKKTSPRYFVV